MPPKALVRPAAAVPVRRIAARLAGGARAKAKAVAKAKPRAKPKAVGKAKPKARAAGELRKRKKRGAEEDQVDENVSEIFAKGLEIEPRHLPVQEWKPGQRVAVMRGLYWEEAVTLAGVVRSVKVEAGGATLSIDLEGSQAEALVKWKGLHPGQFIDIHLCLPDCAHLSKEGLVHGQRMKLVTATNKEDWMDNLLEVRRGAEEETDELHHLRKKATERGAAGVGPEGGVGEAAEALESSSSGEDKKAKEKRRKKGKKKRRDGGEKIKISGAKDLSHVFGTTALDPKPEVRKVVRKKARQAAKHKSKRAEESSSSVSEESSGSASSGREAGTLFGEEVRVKMLWKKYPGALTLNTLEMMQSSVVSQTGQPWSLDRSSLPPIFSQYWRLALTPKMGGAMGRESQTLCFVQDLLMQGRIASACDVITQRLKGLEQISGGGHFTVAQRQELVPVETGVVTSPSEALEASRVQREEYRARMSSARPWERRQEWTPRGEENKGRGKGKTSKGKGKLRGDYQGQAKEDREKGKS